MTSKVSLQEIDLGIERYIGMSIQVMFTSHLKSRHSWNFMIETL